MKQEIKFFRLSICFIYVLVAIKFVFFVDGQLQLRELRVGRSAGREIDALSEECGKLPALDVNDGWGGEGFDCSRVKRARGPKSDDGRPIYNGSELCDSGYFPSFARIILKNKTDGRNVSCAGIIVHKDTILTVQSCFDHNPDAGLVTVGFKVDTRDPRNPEKYDDTKSIMKDKFAKGFCKLPKYSNKESNLIRNDLAILILDSPVTYNNYVQPACLAIHKSHKDSAKCQAAYPGSSTKRGWIHDYDYLGYTNITRKCGVSFPSHDQLTCYPGFNRNKECLEEKGSPIFCNQRCGGRRKQVAVSLLSTFAPKHNCSYEAIMGLSATYMSYVDLYKMRTNLVHMLKYCYLK